MFKIYRHINETWVITNRNLQGLINRPINVAHISKSGIAFTDVHYNFRLGFSSASQKKEKCLCMDFSIDGSKTTANISLYFKATNLKRSFENVTCQSEMTDLPFKLFMDEIKDGKCEIEIKGIFIIERDEYLIIPRSINIDYGLLENTKKDFDIIIASENGKEENIKGMCCDRYEKLPGFIREKRAKFKKYVETFFCKKKFFCSNVFFKFRALFPDKTWQLFVSIATHSFKIHKDVLIIQSPVFEGMLKSGMKESITNTLKIIDFNFTTVIAAIEFFYGHQIFNHYNFKELFQLYRFADKYLIDNLMDYITLFISNRISPLNVAEIYNLAVASNSLMKIKDQCFDFLVFCKNENIPVENFDSVILKN